MSMSRFASIGLICLLSGACTVVIKPAEEREPAPENTEPEPPPPPPPPARPTSTPTRRGVPRLNVPRGHLPAAGFCRVWIENMAPGRQARQESCPGILAAAPAGSWILYRPAHTPSQMRVRYVNQRQAGQIVAVRVYDAQSGRYLQDMALGDDDDNMGPVVGRRTPVQRPPETGRPVTPPGRERAGNGNGVGNGVGNGNGNGNGNGVGNANGNGRGNGNGNTGAGNANGNGRGNATVQSDTAQVDTTATANGNGNNNGRRGNDGNGSRNANANAGNGNANAGNGSSGNGGNSNANSGNGNGRGAPQTRGNDREGPGSRGAGADTPMEADGQLPLSVDVRNFPRMGQCRVWMPGRADSQQARSKSCNGIAREAPAGAWILRRMRNEPDVIYVDYVDERRGGSVVKTSVYDATTRAFLR